METHAKMFIVDDVRLMITSDNTLSFGDTEAERGDAGGVGDSYRPSKISATGKREYGRRG